MTIEEYKYKVQERDTQAIDIYIKEGEAAYWNFLNENKIKEPQKVFDKKEPEVKQKIEWRPHLHKDEMQLLREQYYFNQPGIISSY